MSAERRLQALATVEGADTFGVTARELCTIRGWHHGMASAALSELHEAERLSRLVEKRDKYRIYVTPNHVVGRLTEPFGRRDPRDALLRGLAKALKRLNPDAPELRACRPYLNEED